MTGARKAEFRRYFGEERYFPPRVWPAFYNRVFKRYVRMTVAVTDMAPQRVADEEI